MAVKPADSNEADRDLSRAQELLKMCRVILLMIYLHLVSPKPPFSPSEIVEWRSNICHIFNLWSLLEKYSELRKLLFRGFSDKKAFDRVCFGYGGLW